MKRMLVYLLAACLALGAPLAATAEETARGFATPEQCAMAVFEALTGQDSQTLDDCYAFREMAERYDFQAYVERLTAIVPYNTLLPATNEMNILYNESMLRQRLYARVCYTSMWLADPATAENIGGKTIAMQNDGYQEAYDLFAGASGLGGYASLQYNGLLKAADVPSVGQMYVSERNQTNIVKQMACWLVDDFTELVIVALNGSKVVYMPLRLVEVDDLWYADPSGSNIGSMMGLSAYYLMMEME